MDEQISSQSDLENKPEEESGKEEIMATKVPEKPLDESIGCNDNKNIEENSVLPSTTENNDCHEQMTATNSNSPNLPVNDTTQNDNMDKPADTSVPMETDESQNVSESIESTNDIVDAPKQPQLELLPNQQTEINCNDDDVNNSDDQKRKCEFSETDYNEINKKQKCESFSDEIASDVKINSENISDSAQIITDSIKCDQINNIENVEHINNNLEIESSSLKLASNDEPLKTETNDIHLVKNECPLNDYDEKKECERKSDVENNENQCDNNVMQDKMDIEKNENEIAAKSVSNDNNVPQPIENELDFDLTEKLKDMGEISLGPVTKTERKISSEFNLTDEVSLEITKKSSTDLDDKRKFSNLRKNIREVMDDTQLDASTLAAQREELERLSRVQEQQRIIREMQRQIALERQNSKTQNRVLSLLQGHTSLLKSSVGGSGTSKTSPPSTSAASMKLEDQSEIDDDDLLPSISIAPIKSLHKKVDLSLGDDIEIPIETTIQV